MTFRINECLPGTCCEECENVVSMMDHGPTCDLRGGQNWENCGVSGTLMTKANERTFDRRVL